MSIKGRVGRHNRTGGRNCQNWVDDQQKIVNLLNQISVLDGGTAGQLRPRMIAGIASDELYRSILKFEDKYFPGQRSGYVDPGGRMYQKLAALAGGPVRVTAPAPPWQPTSIEILLAKAENLRRDHNYQAVVSFLTKLQNEGYTKPIQNDRILAYAFGTLRFVKGNNTALSERMHIATPIYSGDGIKPAKNGSVVLVGNKEMILMANGKTERLTGVVTGPVIMEEEIKVTVGPAIIEYPSRVEVEVGTVILE